MNNRIIESFRLEGTLEGLWSNFLLSTKPISNSEPTSKLDHVIQLRSEYPQECKFHSFSGELVPMSDYLHCENIYFFLISTQNFHWCKLCPSPVWFYLPCNIPLGSWSYSKIPHSSPSPSLYVMYSDSPIIFVALCWTLSIMCILWSPKQSVWNKHS